MADLRQQHPSPPGSPAPLMEGAVATSSSLSAARGRSADDWASVRRRKSPAAASSWAAWCIEPGLDGSLSRATVAAFASGTFLNDASASCWFSYLLLYLEEVRGLSPVEAGAVLLAGQAADAFSTPVVGWLSDRSAGIPALRLGRRHTFYLGGSVIVLASFLFVFGVCFPCLVSPGASSTATAASFAVSAALFNIGWSAAQVSVMALVPEMTPHDDERLTLNSARYAVTIGANLYVYTTMALLLRDSGDNRADGEYDDDTYLHLTLAVLAGGVLCAAVFLVAGRTPATGAAAPAAVASKRVDDAFAVTPTAAADDNGAEEMQGLSTTPVPGTPSKPVPAPAASRSGAPPPPPPRGGRTARQWLGVGDFWLTALAYTALRLGVQVTGVYLAFYISSTLEMDQTAIAVVPLLQYAASLGAAAGMRRLSSRLGRRLTVALGGCLYLLGCVGTGLIPRSAPWLMYPAAMLLGAGGASLTVSVLTLQSDLLGTDTGAAATVIGGMSFCDKLTTGVAILGLQAASGAVSEEAQPGFFRIVVSVVPSAAVATCVLAVFFIRGLRGKAAGGGSTRSLLPPPTPIAGDAGSGAASTTSTGSDATPVPAQPHERVARQDSAGLPVTIVVVDNAAASAVSGGAAPAPAAAGDGGVVGNPLRSLRVEQARGVRR